MTNDELFQLFGEVLSHLTGGRQRIELHFSAPKANGVLGRVSKGLDNVVHVFIDPDMSLAGIYGVFLHECAHIRLHVPAMARSLSHVPGHAPAHALAAAAPNYAQGEAEADQLRDQWDAWAAANTWRVYEADYTAAHYQPEVVKLLAFRNFWKG